jgi:hypothetical protein
LPLRFAARLHLTLLVGVPILQIGVPVLQFEGDEDPEPKGNRSIPNEHRPFGFRTGINPPEAQQKAAV